MVPNQKTTALDSFVDQSAPICYGILKPGEHVSDGIPVIKVKNIIGGRIIEGDLLRTSPKIHNQYKRAEVKQGDLLLTIRGTTGRVAIVPSSLAGANITQDTARIRVSSDDEPMYVFYALQSPDVQRQIDLNTVGQAVKGINIAEVRKLRIFHPIGIEQKKIAKILSTWDKAITTTEQLLANSQQQKKALMQQLLTGKKRLLDIKTGVIFERDFKTLSLRDVCSMQAGKFINASDILNGHQDGTYPCFGGNGLRGYTKTFTHDGEFSLIGRQGALCGNITFATGCFHATEHAVVVTPRSNINTKWLYYALVDLNLNQYATGVAQPGLSVKNIEQVSIKVPESINEQQKIAAVLSTADQEITTLKQKLDALKQEKKALMQQLLTGKRRVKVEAAA
ncbi:restriction endonuclease subunit S [Aeromonas veronii]|uniref:restriction endonuclease subunit S n=1 Tax=Aeromonas veronii TaxID=654 RepID=UPI00142F6D6D|nr:restriction endonuclease subunit S [Aeromonas veronii]NJI08968.1 restriction endonuclease subunit S [Aeromonas veronii]